MSESKEEFVTVRLEPGQSAPAFTLVDQDGGEVSLSDFDGQRVILYFYPEAMTEGCTKQACDFRDNLSWLTSAGYQVVGISRDDPAKLKRFQERDRLTFPLLSDPDHAVHDAYGTWGEKKLYGKVVTGVLRSTFVLDRHHVIEQAIYSTKATGHVSMLRKKLGLDAA
jgi:peroxiredoxin Q/BCP